MATNNSSSLPEGSAIRLPGITIEGGNDRYAGLEDLYGFGALYGKDFIDTELGYDPFTFDEQIEGPPSTISPPLDFGSEDSEDTFDMSKFKAPETEEEKQGLLSKIGEALSKVPAKVLNLMLLKAGVKSLGVLAGIVVSRLTSDAVNKTVTPLVENALKAIGNTGKDALGNIVNFRNSPNQSTTDQSTPNQNQEGSNNLQGSEDPFEITDFGSYVVNESDTSSFDDSTSFVNESGTNNVTTEGYSDTSSNNTSVSNQTNNEMSTGTTDEGGTGTGELSEMEQKYNAYLEMVQRMSGKGIESRSQSLEQARGTFGPQLFGAAEDYRTAAMDSFARTAGAEPGSNFQEILSAFTKNDPTEEKRLRDESRAVGVASGRSFDPAAIKGTIDLNQLFQARKTPYIQSMLPELTLGRGMQYAGGLDATVMDTLPSFADQVKFDTAQQQNQFNQDLLQAQRESGDSNRFIQGANALLGAYEQDFLGLKSNVVDPFGSLIADTFKGLFPGNSGSKNNFDYSEYQSQYGFPSEENMSGFLENDSNFDFKLEDFKY